MARSKPKSISGKNAVIPVRALDFVMYNAKDVRKTRAFYQKLFGFRRGHEWTDFWSEFDTQPLALCINGTSKTIRPEWNWMGTPCVGLAVDDVPAAIAKCRKRGVKILIPPVETNACWMAWIADPAGNRICLHSRKDGTAG
jgi:predicted enzyme related to lactoylglutathione lyase